MDPDPGVAMLNAAGTGGLEQRYRFWSGWYTLFIGLIVFAGALRTLKAPNGWTPGDWLINYEGGFVRRGLSGEALLLLARVTHLPLMPVGVMAPVLFYGLLYLAVWRLCQRTSWSLWVVAALVSPATLAFPVLDLTGGYRKELLYLTGLAGLLLLLERSTTKDAALSAYLFVVCTISVLCHEGLLVFLPYYAGALLLGFRDVRRAVLVAIPAVLGVGFAFAAETRHPGSVGTWKAICTSLGPQNADICSGAVEYLSYGKEYAHQQVLFYVHQYHYFFFYPLLALLGTLPLAFGFYRLSGYRELQRDLSVVLGTAILSAGASTPLFIYAEDWGRWIYIHLFSVFLLLLFVDWRRQSDPRMHEELAPRGTAVQRRWKAVVVLIYAISWNIPHYGNYPKKGYFNVPMHLLKQYIDNKRAAKTL